MNIAAPVTASVPLASIARDAAVTIVAIDWTALSPLEAKRLREFGFDDGVGVTLIQRAGWLGGPLAVRVGRMDVALRRHVAAAIRVAPVAA